MKIKITPHNTFGPFPCVLCGESHDQNLAAAELVMDDKIESEWEQPRDVCPECLAAGPGGAAGRARVHAAELRALAESLDNLAGAVEMIPPADWAKPEELEAVYIKIMDGIND